MTSANSVWWDFDGTISPDHYPNKLLSPPNPGLVEYIKSLYNRGINIVIYSCRANPNIVNMDNCTIATAEMIEYLTKYDIPYHTIYVGKPLYGYLVDDRAGFDGNLDVVKRNIEQRILEGNL